MFYIFNIILNIYNIYLIFNISRSIILLKQNKTQHSQNKQKQLKKPEIKVFSYYWGTFYDFQHGASLKSNKRTPGWCGWGPMNQEVMGSIPGAGTRVRFGLGAQ